ncbi:hypothetical protein, partial [Yersinia pestis]|uniref:hypothetical protein n=1 Tax=Yersinia pestis TaxID=632 RepID=UPI0019554838
LAATPTPLGNSLRIWRYSVVSGTHPPESTHRDLFIYCLVLGRSVAEKKKPVGMIFHKQPIV